MEEDRLPFERRPLTRRRLVELTAGIGATYVLAACGGGGDDGATPGAQGEGAPASAKTYDGPNVDLQFWNGFTGRHRP